MRFGVLFAIFLFYSSASYALTYVCSCVDGTPSGSISYPYCVSPQTNAVCVSENDIVMSLDITSNNIIYFFTWGFGSILACWAIGFACGQVKSLLYQL